MEEKVILTFAHYKGGTGKTTSCLSVAGFLAKAGKTVLVVDLDPQGNSTSGLGIDKSTIQENMYNVMAEKKDIREIILATETPNIHIAPATQELALIDMKTYKGVNQARILRTAIKKVDQHYDFVLVDTPPVYSHFIINGMVAADKVFIVLDPGIFAIEGIQTLKQAFGDFFESMGLELKIEAAIISKCNLSFFPWRNKHIKEIQEEVEKQLGKKSYIIPYSDIFYESHRTGKPISHIKPNSSVGNSYNEIVQDILKGEETKDELNQETSE